MRALVVGGAGFIGSHLVDALRRVPPGGSSPATTVRVLDNLSVGRRAHLAAHLPPTASVELVVADALDLDAVRRAAEGIDVLFHLSANPEARWGLERPRLDLEQGTIVTWNVLEAARSAGVRLVVLASSGTVYGEAPGACAEGDLGHLPISLYGASKLAGEAMASAYSECFGLGVRIVRFGNVVGPRGTHGAALDFLRKLKTSARERPHAPELEVLGDGRQAKPYVWVGDCASGLAFVAERALEPGAARLDVFNLAPPDTTSVARIAELCVAACPTPQATIRFTGGEKGWPGDVPRSLMDGRKLARAGFELAHTSDQAVERAVRALAAEVFSTT